ncbi:hypothetical protein [Mesorhizobium salmacidum]|uniref:DUF982 domain-containing protein n=1 Tax=Mesorhizobium salmacidum TaxID=3015171 RepID=A0ABU8KX94_9HYPH
MNGEIVRCGNPDAIIQMMSQSAGPEQRILMATYEAALAALKETNGGPATQFMRQEALEAAMAADGIEVEMTGPEQAPVQ